MCVCLHYCSGVEKGSIETQKITFENRLAHWEAI